MAEFAIVQKAMPTSTGTQDFTSPGFGAPKGALFFASYGATNGTVVDNAMLLIGATDLTNHRCRAFASEDNVTPADVGNVESTTVPVITLLNTSQALDGSASYNGLITDGIQLNWTDAPPTAYLLTVVLIGGSGVASCAVGHTDVSTTLNDAVTVTTGTPTSFVFTWSDSQSSNSRPSLGMVTNDGSNTQRSISSMDEGTNPSQQEGVVDTASVMRAVVGGAGGEKIEISNFTSTGFDMVTRIAGGTSYRLHYLAVQLTGLSAKVATWASPTVTGNDTLSGLGITPQFGLMLHSAVTVLDSVQIDDRAEVLGISVFTASTQNCISWSLRDNVAPSNTESITDTKPVQLRKTSAAFMTATFSGFTSDGATFNYSLADGTARQRVALFVSASLSASQLVPAYTQTGGTWSQVYV